jgi:hypothetical protein
VATAKRKSREETIARIADRIDLFEKYDRSHTRTIAGLAVELARRFGLGKSDLEAIRTAAMLHDIGLYAMSPPYHASPRPLTIEQQIDLWRHPVVGEQQMAKRDASRHAQLLVRWHHEWWNGQGYPDGLAFQDIPIGARILRAAELYCALNSNRPYRAALSEDDAIEVLKASAGIECDPYVIEALTALLEAIRAEIVLAEEEQARAGGNAATDDQFAGELLPLVSAEHPQDATGGLDETNLLLPELGSFKQTSLAQSSLQSAAGQATPARSPATIWDILVSRGAASGNPEAEPACRDWIPSRQNPKSTVGFEVSVLRQLEFRSALIPYCGSSRVAWYLSGWGKIVHANDPSEWAAAAGRSLIEVGQGLTPEEIELLLTDVYVPMAPLSNAAIRRWFGESDAVWLDNLRRRIELIPGELARAEALVLGIRTGDYALSFQGATLGLKKPLSHVLRRMASGGFPRPRAHPLSRGHNLDALDFITAARGELLYLSLPSASFGSEGSGWRSAWRESWVRGDDGESRDATLRLVGGAQSKEAYLGALRGLLQAAAHLKKWAIGYQDTGQVSVMDVTEVVREFREVLATYSKDLTGVSGGLRNYIIVADRR